VNYILDQFQYYWETPFGETNKKFPSCAIDRPPGGNPEVLMGIMNHFLDTELLFGIKIPNQIEAPNTNSQKSIEAQVNLCRGKWGRTPNVILVSTQPSVDFQA
jgi:hypothetical protein